MICVKFIGRALFFIVVAGVSLALFGCASQPDAVETTRLHILLTNDDGYDAPGINAVRLALLAAGHTVTVVAPLSNQSGSGVRVATGGTLDYREQATGVWSVDGFPADSVLVGLLQIMKERPPDLVVSGANFGQNLGYAVSSGTVGAATVAMYAGFPAIALSVGVDLSEQNAEPVPFPSTLRAFDGAAELCVQIIGELQKARTVNGRLLPAHTILNVNYPAAEPDEIKGIRILQAARSAGVRFDYEETEDAGRLRIVLTPLQPANAESHGTDWRLFAQGFVTISVLDGDWDAGQPLRDDISRRLSVVAQ